MSQSSIRNALENALAAITPAIDIVHENQSYVPIAGQPFAEAYVLFATPANPTMGDGFYQELGIFQINLQYPTEVGTADAAAQAQLIRDAFPRGATFVFGGVTVQVDRTPEIGAGTVDGDRWFLPIRVRWHADIYT
jgi:hypothetical protein